jgi:hypothetical protein
MNDINSDEIKDVIALGDAQVGGVIYIFPHQQEGFIAGPSGPFTAGNAQRAIKK